MKKFTALQITTLGLMLSMIFVLSTLEGALFPLPFHMRFGLSNVVTMYALFFMGKRAALTLTAMKSLSVLLTRGPIAGLLSLSGGMLSLLAIALLATAWRGASYFLLSVAGAVTHNMAQLAVASWLASTNLLFFLLPLMAGAGILAGSLTAVLLRVVMPLFKNLPFDRGVSFGDGQSTRVSRT
ncbi:MAG: Gx transporter family protein [Synergistaceae bacterium]|jgi:heptaprenyl diphosphate synthase|nr:Gx transporter family protein [Synergistaceae bacterium]